MNFSCVNFEKKYITIIFLGEGFAQPQFRPVPATRYFERPIEDEFPRPQSQRPPRHSRPALAELERPVESYRQERPNVEPFRQERPSVETFRQERPSVESYRPETARRPKFERPEFVRGKFEKPSFNRPSGIGNLDFDRAAEFSGRPDRPKISRPRPFREDNFVEPPRQVYTTEAPYRRPPRLASAGKPFENPVKPFKEEREPASFPTIPPFSANDFSFGGFGDAGRPIRPKRNQRLSQRPQVSLRDLYENEGLSATTSKRPFELKSQDLYNEVPELVVPEPRPINRQPFQPLRRPKRKRPIFQNSILANAPAKKRYPFVPHERPTQLVDYRAKPRPGGNRPQRKKFQEYPEGPRITTPRPIPTPGPGDFPAPPPQRARPPPTHPTHPPLPTHPPEHYDTVTQRTPSSPINPLSVLPFENEIDDSKSDYDYDYSGDTGSSNQESDGFFEFPGSFPSLEQLGAGFESMKIRNKRSLPDAFEEELLIASEARRLLRNRNRNRNRPRLARLRAQRQQQQARQGFNFHDNFWNGDPSLNSDDFFTNFGGDSFDRKFNQYESSGLGGQNGLRQQRYTLPNSFYQQQDAYRRDPYTEQTIQNNPYPSENDYYSENPYGGYIDNNLNNEILGSGNFEVIKGGTFYDDDTYYYSTYNQRPQYGQQFFENFRDFADIKNDRYNDDNSYNYYPRYK